MKRIFILLIMPVFLLTGCNQSTAREKVRINQPKDNTVNGYLTSGAITADSSMPDVITASDVEVTTQEVLPNTDSSTDYCGNKNSKVFHASTCSSVNKMKDENKVYLKSRQEFIDRSYKPCGICKP